MKSWSESGGLGLRRRWCGDLSGDDIGDSMSRKGVVGPSHSTKVGFSGVIGSRKGLSNKSDGFLIRGGVMSWSAS